MPALARSPALAGWSNQLDVVEILVPTYVNVLLAFEPRALIAAMHTTIIRASMTAYSTAVGPSSFFRKFRANCPRVRIDESPSVKVSFCPFMAANPASARLHLRTEGSIDYGSRGATPRLQSNVFKVGGDGRAGQSGHVRPALAI